MLIADPAMRRAIVRGATWSVVSGLVTITLSALEGRPALVGLSAAVILGCVVAGPSGWLEARARARRSERVRGLTGIALLVVPSLLGAFAIVQLQYATLVLKHGSTRHALGDLIRQLDGDLLLAAIAGGLVVGVAFSAAGFRRVNDLRLGEVAGWLVGLSVVTCLAGFAAMVAWVVVELVNAAADVAERAWIGLSAEAGSLTGLDRRRVRLLAYLGEEAALRAVGDDPPPVPIELDDWVRGLEQWVDGAGLRRAAAVTVRRVLRETPPRDGWEAAWEAVRRWADAPQEETAGAASVAIDAAPAPETDVEWGLCQLRGVLHPSPWGVAGSLARTLARMGDREQIREEVAAEMVAWATNPPSVPFQGT